MNADLYLAPAETGPAKIKLFRHRAYPVDEALARFGAHPTKGPRVKALAVQLLFRALTARIEAENSIRVRTGENACFGVAGKVWAALDQDGRPVASIPMSESPFYGRFASGVNYFGLYREAARRALAPYGRVISGIASCGTLTITA